MPYHVLINGIDVTCDIVSEAVALANHAAKLTKPAGKPPANPTQDARKDRAKSEVINFLRAVDRSGDQGVGGDALVETVGCTTRAALGGVVSTAQRLLEDVKIPFDEVAFRVRKGDSKLWKAAPRIKDAINALKDSDRKFLPIESGMNE